MTLNELWFILILVLFGVYFFLEGFDFGTGILMPFMAKTDTEKRLMINSIGPVWDANEVWLLTGGGAMFAAFPGWYATMFSGFYLPLFLILAALIVRGVAFEFRGKHETAGWKKAWDIGIFLGSLLPPLLLAVAFANLVKGVPIDEQFQFTGNFFSLLSVPTLLSGVAAVSVFVYHGAVFQSLKQNGALKEKFVKSAKSGGFVAVILTALTFVAALVSTEVGTKPLSIVLAVVAIVLLAVSTLMMTKENSRAAVILNGLAIVLGVAAVFAGMFPNVMVSSTAAANSLTITNASSTPYTLKVMTIVTVTVLPIVLVYTAWTYWVFRKRMQTRDLEY